MNEFDGPSGKRKGATYAFRGIGCQNRPTLTEPQPVVRWPINLPDYVAWYEPLMAAVFGLPTRSPDPATAVEGDDLSMRQSE